MNKLTLALETLEDRLLLSGNVFVDGANLVVEGTTAFFVHTCPRS